MTHVAAVVHAAGDAGTWYQAETHNRDTLQSQSHPGVKTQSSIVLIIHTCNRRVRMFLRDVTSAREKPSTFSLVSLFCIPFL